MTDAILGKSEGKEFKFPLENLKKHFIALGSSGSGKTVLSKVMIEECAKNNVPAIVIDPQGDLASLAMNGDLEQLKEKGISEADYETFKNNTNVTIFTPTSKKGIPICLNPFQFDKKDIDEDEIIPIIHSVATSVASLVGYNVDNDKGKAAEAVIYTVLKKFYGRNKIISSFHELIEVLSNLDDDIKDEIGTYIRSDKDVDELIRKLKFMSVGEKNLLFSLGQPIDIDVLLGKNTDKTQISIIYLNTLQSQKDKEFFLTILTSQLYQWMLDNPTDTLQCVFMIDEIAPYIPAGARKPIPKPILKMLFKQARKYGVGCCIATQNPGDIDYKAFAQFGTWAIGRLSLKQDQKKVEGALKSLSSVDLSSYLPKLTPGNFILFAPDIDNTLIDLKVRWLFTEHKTLKEDEVKKLMADQQGNFKSIKTPKTEIQVTESKTLKVFDSISENQALEIANKNRKRAFVVGKKEEITDFKGYLIPYFKTTIKTVEKKNLGLSKQTNEYELFFNAVDGTILKIKNKNFWEFDFFGEIINFKEDQLKILNFINQNNKVTTTDIINSTGLNPNIVNKKLTEFSTNETIDFEKEGKNFVNISIPVEGIENVSKISSIGYNITENETKLIKKIAKITQNKIENVIKFFLNSEIVSVELVNLPIFEVKFSQNSKVRSIKINGASGNIIEY
jgi:DNA helicase HerA-like ATPase